MVKVQTLFLGKISKFLNILLILTYNNHVFDGMYTKSDVLAEIFREGLWKSSTVEPPARKFEARHGR